MLKAKFECQVISHQLIVVTLDNSDIYEQNKTYILKWPSDSVIQPAPVFWRDLVYTEFLYLLVSRSGIVPTKIVMTIWQWVAVSIIYNNIYNSGWNEQRRFVTGHGNLTICLAAKSGNQRSAISHNPVAHKCLWTRCSYPNIRGSGFRFKPGSQLCRLSCRVPLIVFWLATVIIMVSFTNHDLTGNVQSGTDLDFC